MRGRWSQGGEQQVGHPELEEALSRGPDGLKMKSTYSPCTMERKFLEERAHFVFVFIIT